MGKTHTVEILKSNPIACGTMKQFYLVHLVGQGSRFESQYGRIFLHHPQMLIAVHHLMYGVYYLKIQKKGEERVGHLEGHQKKLEINQSRLYEF